MTATNPVTQPLFHDSFNALPDALRPFPFAGHRAMLVGDTHTLALFGQAVRERLESVFCKVSVYEFEAGEEHKTLNSVKGLLAAMIDGHFDRKDCIVALGGGVVGDMGGFAAAIYLRGIPVVQIPTTLLAQVDSSIGGKTGVDFDGYKNMIGAFHMPACIYTNVSVLSALPDDQFASGMGEVIKSALLGDAALYRWLQTNRDGIAARDPALLLEMIRRTAGIKVEIVTEDPTEQGRRALLNLGHTVGHAVEKACRFTMMHGACVAVGLAAAASMSVSRGLIREEDRTDIIRTLHDYGLPSSVSGLRAEDVLRITKSDKKMSDGQIRFILLRSPGSAFYTDDVTDGELLEGIRSVLTD